ncbi:hypothetical protein GCK72_016452 [Caenorhabditis remanei]|uniref:Uncharacterized protein n=1 Tax=Caenorhabditis remanei TaxID=31234 RepID=E3MQW2_CAERE|nr:hypothetical protein GCK72_016452 [Caenorhabditis remanei]EFP07108.1 hypothetical protein CRE_12853 [Caenorhabditis remanei]KAF1749907.1 hypothetical protein GCK72_016452 [Caenorhabditis remanei]
MSSTSSNHTAPSKKYSLVDAEHSYFYIPPCKSIVHSEKPLTVFMERNTVDGIELEWIKHSPLTVVIYILVALLTVLYYATCFVFQYGNYLPKATRNSVFDEAFLTRVVIVQWLVLLAILTSGVFLYRRLFMPLYIFMSVMATNGTLVLFVLKVKQLVDEKITIMDISLNLLGLLLFCALLHDIVYFYAIHLKLIESRPSFAFPHISRQSGTLPNQYSTIHSDASPLPNKTSIDIV